MEAEMYVDTLIERLDGTPVSDKDIIALREELNRIIHLAWADGVFNLPGLVIDCPLVSSHFD